MTSPAKELVRFLQIGSRLDLKTAALQNILGLTGSNEGLELILEIPELLVALISLLDDSNESVSKLSALCLVNISANKTGADLLLSLDLDKNCPPLQKPPDHIIRTVLKFIFNQESQIADTCCMILSNLTRITTHIASILEIIESNERTLEELVKLFDKRGDPSGKFPKLHYLAPSLSNLTQSSKARNLILAKDKLLIQRLVTYIDYSWSDVRQNGIIGAIRNCCFETEFHDWLLSEDIDILPYLLLPLAGNEEFSEEDNDKLPPDLQYLDLEKVRNEDPNNRRMLLEAITQLCTKKENREFIRAKNTYVILRELHKWEKDKNVLLACENLVDILIRTEEEIGKDNLREIDIPEHLVEDFHKFDEEFVKEAST